jgi:hypothetical protein
LKVSSLAFHLEASSGLKFLKGFWESHFTFGCGGSFHLPFIEFILSHLDSSSTNMDKELLEEIVANDPIAMQFAIACFNTWEYFTSTKLEKKSEQPWLLCETS